MIGGGPGTSAVLHTRGPTAQPFAWASVTKLLTALAVHVACEEGTLDLDGPLDLEDALDLEGTLLPPEATVAHLLAHASGLGFEAGDPTRAPATRRTYSNIGYEVLAAALADAADMPFATYLADAVLGPLGMTATRLAGSAAAGAVGPVDDLARLASELLDPTLLSPEGAALVPAVAFPGLDGVLPGFGLRRPNDWGLGPEVRGTKEPHWTPPGSSPATFGHFGQAGGFLWVDPEARVACAVLGARAFGPWARTAWPVLGSAVLAATRPG